MLYGKDFNMNLRIAENYQLLKQEVTTHWKTGAVMTGVALVVYRVYGKAAAGGVLLATVSNYQILGQQIRVISWMNLRKTLIAVVIFGNSYYNVINPQMMSYLAVALMLIDNFQLSGINADLSTQNKSLEENNLKLKEAYDALKKLEKELQTLLSSGADLEKAQKAKTEKVETLQDLIPEHIQNMPARLLNVSILLKQLMNTEEMQERMKFEAELRSKINSMVQAFEGVLEELQPLTEKVSKLSDNLDQTVSKLHENVILTDRQIQALGHVLKNLPPNLFPKRVL